MARIGIVGRSTVCSDEYSGIRAMAKIRSFIGFVQTYLYLCQIKTTRISMN